MSDSRAVRAHLAVGDDPCAIAGSWRPALYAFRQMRQVSALSVTMRRLRHSLADLLSMAAGGQSVVSVTDMQLLQRDAGDDAKSTTLERRVFASRAAPATLQPLIRNPETARNGVG